MSELGDLLEEVRRLLEARTITVTDVDDGGNDYQRPEPDPAFAPLLAMVREECPGWWENGAGLHLCKRLPLCTCGGTGLLTRTAYWEAAPDSAFPGAAIEAAWNIPGSYRLIDNLVYILITHLDIEIDMVDIDKSQNQRGMEALRDFLKES